MYEDPYTHHKRAGSEDSGEDLYDPAIDLKFAGTPGYHDPHAAQYPATPFLHPEMQSAGYYEVDVRTERQMFVNGISTRRDSSISTFNTFVPPPPHVVLPSFTGDEFLQPGYLVTPTAIWINEVELDIHFLGLSHGPLLPQTTPAANVKVDARDRELLTHLIEHVLPMVFPILNANQCGTVMSDIILPALENNQAYLHCCLSAAAIHSKSLGLSTTRNVNGDVLGHKLAFVQQVVTNLNADSNHAQVLEATLGMISMQCVTGHADDRENDIPWHQHFLAASELVRKLNLPTMLGQLPPQAHAARLSFNMTLTAWIDILGATMLGRSPLFADTYRNQYLAAGSTGLTELMGCRDNVMYLLSEIACLDSLRLDQRLNHNSVCSQVEFLGHQLDATEFVNDTLQQPYSSSGSICPRLLSKNITAIFRKAVWLHLCSIVPEFDRSSQKVENLVQNIADMMSFIPGGAVGYDRSLVWPLLIAGFCSMPASAFRKVLVTRTEAMGFGGKHGNFGRMINVVQKCWKRNDDIAPSAVAREAVPITTGALVSLDSSLRSLVNTDLGPRSMPQTALKEKHWREVMKENNWEFLLI